MMRAEYDSQADALSIDLLEAARFDANEDVDEEYCHVAFAAGHPANVELLAPADHLDLLSVAADRYGFDAAALAAAAQAALAAPARALELRVSASALA